MSMLNNITNTEKNERSRGAKKLGAIRSKSLLLFVAFLFLGISLIGLCSCLGKVVRPAGLDKLKVSVLENEGVILDSESIVEVASGKSAVFTLKIKDGYIYNGNSAGAHYDPKTGKLTVSVVKYPMSVEVYLINTGKMMKLELEGPSDYLVAHDGEDEWFDDGETVTVSALESAAYNFIGWSVGGYIENGGVLVSSEKDYSFAMTDGIKLYANYKQADQYTIVYHANGGSIKGSTEDTMTVKSKKGGQFTCRNTIHSNGTFIREGYVAVGYSTEPVVFEDYACVNDIPGFSNMGGICVVPEETCLLELYVVWAKATSNVDFRFTLNGNSITIEKYRGKDSVVVIPESINGIPVTTIKAQAFANSSVKNVVIPKYIKTIEDYAFSGCSKLTQVVFFDGVTQVSNASFNSSNNISTIVLNSQQYPYHAGSGEGTFCIKYERVKTAPGKMLVVVSGSSTLNGMDSTRFQTAYPDYTIVNYGTNAGTPSYFYLKVIANYVGEGDIIIHAGEHGGTTMGSNQIQWKLFRGNEQSYDIFREVDMTEFTNFWGAFHEFQWNGEIGNESKNRTTKPGSGYQVYCSSLNEYGDLITNRPANKNNYTPNGGINFMSPASYMSAANVTRMNAVNKIIASKGGVMLASFATLDIRAVNSDQQNNQAAYDYYTQYFIDKLDYAVISNVGTYTLDKKYMYDSQWHCTNDGATLRTTNLLADLAAYLADPDSYK